MTVAARLLVDAMSTADGGNRPVSEPRTSDRHDATVVSTDDEYAYVTVDGSDEVTPCVMQVGCAIGHRVTVQRGGDGVYRIVNNTTDPPDNAIARKAEATALAVQEAVGAATAGSQYFWHNSDDEEANGGAGAHITDDTQEAWRKAVADGFSDLGDGAGGTKPWYNVLVNSIGALWRSGLDNLVAITRSAIAFYDGQGNSAANVTAQFGRDGARVGILARLHLILANNKVEMVTAAGTPAWSVEAPLRMAYHEDHLPLDISVSYDAEGFSWSADDAAYAPEYPVAIGLSEAPTGDLAVRALWRYKPSGGSIGTQGTMFLETLDELGDQQGGWWSYRAEDRTVTVTAEAPKPTRELGDGTEAAYDDAVLAGYCVTYTVTGYLSPSMTHRGDAEFLGRLDVGDGLGVGGDAEVVGGLAVGGDAEVVGGLAVGGDATVGGLVVGGRPRIGRDSHPTTLYRNGNYMQFVAYGDAEFSEPLYALRITNTGTVQRRYHEDGAWGDWTSTTVNSTNSRAANCVYAAPNGSNGTASWRKLVAADIPNLNASKITVGALALARGGTGSDNTSVDENTVFAGPSSEKDVGASWRKLVAADIPNLNASKVTAGALALARGGTGSDNTSRAINTVFAGPSSGSAGNASWRKLVAADIPTLSRSAKLSSGSGTVTIFSGVSVAKGGAIGTSDDVFNYRFFYVTTASSGRLIGYRSGSSSSAGSIVAWGGYDTGSGTYYYTATIAVSTAGKLVNTVASRHDETGEGTLVNVTGVYGII